MASTRSPARQRAQLVGKVISPGDSPASQKRPFPLSFSRHVKNVWKILKNPAVSTRRSVKKKKKEKNPAEARPFFVEVCTFSSDVVTCLEHSS